MVHWSAPNVSNSIFVLGNAPRSVRIDAVVVSGHPFGGRYARAEQHFEGIPGISLSLINALRPRPLNVFEG